MGLGTLCPRPKPAVKEKVVCGPPPPNRVVSLEQVRVTLWQLPASSALLQMERHAHPCAAEQLLIALLFIFRPGGIITVAHAERV